MSTRLKKFQKGKKKILSGNGESGPIRSAKLSIRILIFGIHIKGMRNF